MLHTEEHPDLALRVTTTPVLTSGDPLEKQKEIVKYFDDTFTVYEKLFDILARPQAFFMKAEPLRHPLIFYFGHTACFFVNKLVLGGFMKDRVDAEIETSCAVGVDEMSWDDLDESHYAWPNAVEAEETPERALEWVRRVKAYRAKVREEVGKLTRTAKPPQLPLQADDFWWVILMGIEHERIHLETSAVIMRRLPLSEVRQVMTDTETAFWGRCTKGIFGGDWEEASKMIPKNELKSVVLKSGGPTGSVSDVQSDGRGRVRQGRSWEESRFYGWDNEFGSVCLEISPFSASKYVVSHAEYFEFMRENGYRQKKYWTDEGWRWIREMRMDRPLFWICPDGRRDNSPGPQVTEAEERGEGAQTRDAKSLPSDGWRLRTFLEEIPLPWDWPVETNCLEAQAFCNWKADKIGVSLRLATAFEWKAMRDLAPFGDPSDWTSSPSSAEEKEKREVKGNVNLEAFASSCPVTLFQQVPEEEGGFFDVVGNVWQHTESHQDVFGGFKVHPLYDDFTTPTVDGKHNEIKGGCWISTGNEATADARYAFRRHFYQFAGIRYVHSQNPLGQFVHGVCAFEDDQNTADSLASLCSAPPSHLSALAASVGPGEVGAFANALRFPTLLSRHAWGEVNTAKERDGSVVEIGCGVGLSVVEFARLGAARAVGVDLTARDFQAGDRLVVQGRCRWAACEEGELVEYSEARLESVLQSEGEKGREGGGGSASADEIAKKILFVQNDACNLDVKKLGRHDVVVGSLRLFSAQVEGKDGGQPLLRDPSAFFSSLPLVCLPGAVVVLACPAVGLPFDVEREMGSRGFHLIEEPSQTVAVTRRSARVSEGTVVRVLKFALAPQSEILSRHETPTTPSEQREPQQEGDAWAVRSGGGSEEGDGEREAPVQYEEGKEKERSPLSAATRSPRTSGNGRMKKSGGEMAEKQEEGRKAAAAQLPSLNDFRQLASAGSTWPQTLASLCSALVSSADGNKEKDNEEEGAKTTVTLSVSAGALSSLRGAPAGSLPLFPADKSLSVNASTPNEEEKKPSAEEAQLKFLLQAEGFTVRRGKEKDEQKSNIVISALQLEASEDPERALRGALGQVAPGGFLLVASSYDWKDAVTSKEKRLGGVKKDGEDFTAEEALRDLLSRPSPSGQVPSCRQVPLADLLFREGTAWGKGGEGVCWRRRNSSTSTVAAAAGLPEGGEGEERFLSSLSSSAVSNKNGNAEGLETVHRPVPLQQMGSVVRPTGTSRGDGASLGLDFLRLRKGSYEEEEEENLDLQDDVLPARFFLDAPQLTAWQRLV
uniref:Sulfatase-modifying factor enzyme-like domain-containing protein n=1 Tax=Chromera velia CCMP2878 TaxID=1169474 RepID=A0A0G4F7R0_9ALVE|eukprot:Cvel_2930.t1-p1 / transcript=Cvel_2930.t1 / gene=Cvel_2930 / organism=Chromera_velia_CCMP2878 / gene_product=hypothetical protein / transcript_product=hypothetical protein / location=Cvel_scaffold116:3524-11184(+) / protein_length=1283 / sequence_SO=supercontig / SO=protein_coding / is_pseudo=false